MLPLLAASEAEVKAGRDPIFNSHMWDGSAETLEENLRIGRELLARTHAAKMILEVEIGAVGGEEDGVENAINDKLYSTIEDGLATVAALGSGEHGRYITALTFGNVQRAGLGHELVDAHDHAHAIKQFRAVRLKASGQRGQAGAGDSRGPCARAAYISSSSVSFDIDSS